MEGSGRMYYLLPSELLFFFFRFGGSAVALHVSPAVFDRTRRENLLLPSWRSLRYVFAFALPYYRKLTLHEINANR